MNEHVARALTTVAATKGVLRRYPAGALVFAEGDRSTDVLLIRSGSIRIVAGEGEAIDEIGAGAILGEFAAFDGFPRSASAVAVTDVELVAVDAATAVQTVSESPDIDIDELRADVSTFRDRTERRAIESGGVTVASLAAQLAGRIGDQPGTVVAVEPGSLADELGVSRELTARALDHLHHTGVVSLERGIVVVHDPTALRELALIRSPVRATRTR
jgi:CRP-like cAMP-binding protein